MQDIPHFKPKLHVFICTNERTLESTTPSCSPTITKENIKEVKRWLLMNGLVRDVYCTKVSCLGFCNPEGGVMCIYPAGRFVIGLKNVEEIKKVIKEELEKI